MFVSPDGVVAQLVSLIIGVGKLTTLVIPNGQRNAGVVHRSAISAVDKLTVPTAATGSDVTTGGSLLASTTYNLTYSAGNRFGQTTVPAVGPVATAADASNTHVYRATLTQVTDAVHYDIFLSTAAAPLWVGRITEAQRAAGCTITAVGTVTATSPGAGKVDVQVVGTGVASNSFNFANNTAWNLGSITPVDCDGYSKARIYAKLTVTDLRASLSGVSLCVFTQAKAASTGDWYQLLPPISFTPLGSGGTLLWELIPGTTNNPNNGFTIDGATGLVVAVAGVSNGTAPLLDVIVNLA